MIVMLSYAVVYYKLFKEGSKSWSAVSCCILLYPAVFCCILLYPAVSMLEHDKSVGSQKLVCPSPDILLQKSIMKIRNFLKNGL